MTQQVRRWIHGRKGPIRGVIVWENDEWMDVRLVGDHEIRYLSVTQRLDGPTDDGEVLRVRKSFLTEQVQP